MDLSAAAALYDPAATHGASAVSVAGHDAEIIPLASGALAFRGWRLLPQARILLLHGQPVKIGSRAFDLLHLLLRSRGAVGEREEIIRHVWPTTRVDDTNLRFQMSCLRKTLGEDRDLLKTVPGRGYILAAEAVARPAPAAREPPPALLRAGRLTGEDLAAICEILHQALNVSISAAARLQRVVAEPDTQGGATPVD